MLCLLMNGVFVFPPQDRVVIAVAYDCVDKMVYWTDISGPAISRASLSGGDIIPVITTGTTHVRVRQPLVWVRIQSPPRLNSAPSVLRVGES